MDHKIVKLQKYLEEKGLSKQASFLMWLLGACKSENELVSLTPTNSDGTEDSGSETITVDSLPPCVQTISWIPKPEDPRWSGNGVPVSEFKIVGRNGVSNGFSIDEVEYGASKGDLDSIYINISESVGIQCIWSYVCDIDSYWSSNYNTWDYVREHDDGSESYGMDIIYNYYDEAPLIRVAVNFPIENINGEMFVKLPELGSGGSVSHHSIDDDCVQAYLEAIGEEINE